MTSVAVTTWIVTASSLAAQTPSAEPKVGTGLTETPPAGDYKGFIEENATWLIAGIVIAILVVVVWALRGSGRRAEQAAVAVRRPVRNEQARQRYSSTRIQVADIDDKLGTKVEETEIETDREYALVVDEEALQETVDPATGTGYVNDTLIVQLLREKRFDEAYAQYDGRLRKDGSLEFHPGVEERLGNHFLAAGELEKAARVFEHYVTTHAAHDVRPEVYFNLGYIHFVQRTANKSKRFLRLFLDASDNPAHVERAERILAQLNDGEA